MLDENGQYLPFDPPLVDAGATLGGTVAAGLSGSGRFRYGGVRDFLLGVKLVTRANRVVFGGGKVVKNAAGFDIPKLMIGSLGQYGVMTELTFKVFPRPQQFVTLLVPSSDAEVDLARLERILRAPLDLTCADYSPTEGIAIMLGGSTDAMAARVQRVGDLLDCKFEQIEGDDQNEYWRHIREFDWQPTEFGIARIPISFRQLAKAEQFLSRFESKLPRRYSAGGANLWITWPTGGSIAKFEGICHHLSQAALAVLGKWPTKVLGANRSADFEDQLSKVFCEI